MQRRVDMQRASKEERETDGALATALRHLAACLATAKTRGTPLGSASRKVLEGASVVLHELMLNDSFMDWSARPEVYVHALEVTRRLAERTVLARLVLEPAKACSRSAAEAIFDVTSQARTFLERSVVGDSVDDSTCGLAKLIEETSTKLKASSAAVLVRKGRLRKVGHEGKYEDLMRPYAFEDADLMRTHYFRAKTSTGSRTLSGGGTERARSTRVAKELSVLSASLPVYWASSIFVRADENNVGVLRALILPSLDTPYGGGAFEFDILLPPDYPTSPPSVQFLTTGGGKVYFNPNLYASGKVCLSLLGTWQGPGWDPTNSTILQVLVSIQSMVLCEDPWFNEPGRERCVDSAHSKEYNAGLRMSTLTTALLPTLRKLNVSRGLESGGMGSKDPFEEALTAHYRLKRVEIENAMDRWKTEAHGTKYNYDEAVSDVKNAFSERFDRGRVCGTGGDGGSSRGSSRHLHANAVDVQRRAAAEAAERRFAAATTKQ